MPQEARQQMALRYVHTYGSITSGIYRKLTGVGENTATRDLEALVEKGVWGEAREILCALEPLDLVSLEPRRGRQGEQCG